MPAVHIAELLATGATDSHTGISGHHTARRSEAEPR
jgi:hypothetical protein